MVLRWQKQADYFTVSVYQDLVGDWILTQSWGNSLNDDSEFSHTVLPSRLEAEKYVTKLRLSLLKSGFKESSDNCPLRRIYE
ncbi:hypothetical protein ADINL_2192 [Nitrincola lacisaponensis]|uniref:WGR domain-containing protein n=1 Tax=Nitrincola lacisaponensis TaxID=267850 RepID=A0A063XY48_9GAMM|nr:hypothetical protein [Nitrincola lacisaponensis]KDE39063.1 hypothetical protein ADINL_2192 [Nitrincola lacisaponensis]